VGVGAGFKGFRFSIVATIRKVSIRKRDKFLSHVYLRMDIQGEK